MKCFLLLLLTFGLLVTADKIVDPKLQAIKSLIDGYNLDPKLEEVKSLIAGGKGVEPELEAEEIGFHAFWDYGLVKKYTASEEGVYLNATISNPLAKFTSGSTIIRDLTLKCKRAKLSGTVIQTFTAECENLDFDADGFSFETGHIKGEKAKTVLKKAAWLYCSFDGEQFIGDDIGPQNKPDIDALRKRAGSFGRFIDKTEDKGDMTLDLNCKSATIKNVSGTAIRLQSGELFVLGGSIDHDMTVEGGNVTIQNVTLKANIIFKNKGKLTVWDTGLSNDQQNETKSKVVGDKVEVNFSKQPVFP